MASLRQLRSAPSSERYSFNDYVQWITTAGTSFPTYGGSSSTGEVERPDGSFESFAGVYKTNGIVSACMNVRLRIFSEVVFRFVGLNNGKLGKPFGTPALRLLEKPWPNGTTGELAARMIQDADLAGNFFAVRHGDRLYRRDPGKVSIILTGNPLEDEFADVAGYLYRPGGTTGPTFSYLPNEMCHWSPLPDPLHSYRGMSWLTPVLREIRADNAATDHKAKFFDNGATPNMIVKFPEGVMTEAQFERFKAKMEANYAGATKAYKTLYLAPGADVEVVGKDFQQLDFGNTQGRDETRIASAAGVPAVIVGLKESLAGSSLNAGNMGTARRILGDGTMRPLFRSAAAALETLVPAPQEKGASKLWYDDSNIAFFREDRADAASIQQVQAATIASYIQAGFTPESSVLATEADDRSLLEHTGLFSVQLQPAGSVQAPPQRSVELDATRSAAQEREPAPIVIHNHLPEQEREQPAPIFNVHNHLPEQEREQVPAPIVNVAAPVVNVTTPEQPAPVVNVSVDPTPVTVNNRNEVHPAPVSVLPSEPKSRRVVRDSKGEIIKVVEE